MLQSLLIFLFLLVSIAFVISVFFEKKLKDSINMSDLNLSDNFIKTKLNNELEAFVSSSYGLTNNDLETFLKDYSNLIFQYIQKAKKEIIVYNYPVDQKEISVKLDASKISIIRQYYKKYFHRLENEVIENNLDYKRVFLAPNKYHFKTDKILVKQYSNHISKLLEADSIKNSFFIAENDFINYNFLIVDNKYLLIELYKQTKEGYIIPDNLFVFEKKSNSENDIVTIHSNMILKTDIKAIKLSYYKKLMSNDERMRKRKISEIENEMNELKLLIRERQRIIESTNILKNSLKETEINLLKKKEEINYLTSIIEVLNSELGFIRSELKELTKEHSFLISQHL